MKKNHMLFLEHKSSRNDKMLRRRYVQQRRDQTVIIGPDVYFSYWLTTYIEQFLNNTVPLLFQSIGFENVIT